jgi:hypothetical protein
MLLIFAPPLFWWDYRHRGTLVVPTLFGFACIITCARLMWWGCEELAEVRGRENAPRKHSSPEGMPR